VIVCRARFAFAFGLADEGSPAAVIEVPTPEPGPGEVRVRVRASSVNGEIVVCPGGRWPSREPWNTAMLTGIVSASRTSRSQSAESGRSATLTFEM